MSIRSRITTDPDALAAAFVRTRAVSEALVAPLEPEDTCVQSMPDVSPSKWHLAHTSWFFETFVLDQPGYEPFEPRYAYLFNSYYQTVGSMHPRPRRGLLSRPTLAEVLAYRRTIDERTLAALPGLDTGKLALVELGLHHEQQHQELLLTDIKHVLAQNPLAPSYRRTPLQREPTPSARPLGWIEHAGGLVELGRDLAAPGAAFGFDNEGPRHKVWLEPFTLADRPSSCAEYLAFIDDGGYARPDLWLAEGWDTIRREGWRAPLYWQQPREAGEPWREFTLDGLREINPAAPVCHLSYFEADAFARWSGARLPSEAEWEQVASARETTGNLLPLDAAALAQAPLAPLPGRDGASQWFGDVWEWTASPYVPYPGFAPAPGAVGEYNGKFMCNQLVLRGGSCATPANHIRASYRNFFPSSMRWQFCGVRLAR